MSSTLTVLRSLVSLCRLHKPIFFSFCGFVMAMFQLLRKYCQFRICQILVCAVEFSFVFCFSYVVSCIHSISISTTPAPRPYRIFVPIARNRIFEGRQYLAEEESRMPYPENEERKRNSIAKHKSHTWTLDVTDDATRGVVHEFNADLSDTTTGAYTQPSLASNIQQNTQYILPRSSIAP